MIYQNFLIITNVNYLYHNKIFLKLNIYDGFKTRFTNYQRTSSKNQASSSSNFKMLQLHLFVHFIKTITPHPNISEGVNFFKSFWSWGLVKFQISEGSLLGGPDIFFEGESAKLVSYFWNRTWLLVFMLGKALVYQVFYCFTLTRKFCWHAWNRAWLCPIISFLYIFSCLNELVT